MQGIGSSLFASVYIVSDCLSLGDSDCQWLHANEVVSLFTKTYLDMARE
jgi:hypothetical protein